MERIQWFTIVSLFVADPSSAQLPTYTPHRLHPIPWPADSPTPQLHASDFALVFFTVSGDSLGIQRSPVAWGTGVVDEWFFVFVPPANGEQLPGAFHRDSLWAATSFYDECGACATGDPQHGRITVAGCLFVADDSLLAYGVVHDSSTAARSYADSTGMRRLTGYYRFVRSSRRLMKVANIDRAFLVQCRTQLATEGRSVDHP